MLNPQKGLQTLFRYMDRRPCALLAPLQSVQTQPSHAVTSVIRSVVHQAPFVARVPVTASKLLMEPLAARVTIRHAQEGEHCSVYQMRALIGTGVVRKLLLAVVRTRSG